jgi:hypothetical protein
MWFLALFCVVGSGVLLALSVVPGMFEQIPDRPAWIVGGIFSLFAGLSAIWHLVRTPRADRPRRRTSPLVVLVALVLTLVLLTTLTPRRLVFNRYQPQFEALLANAPPPGNRSTANLNADLGLFWIDQWGTDARGGTYFRTMVGTAPENRSFGFAYRPNTDGSPFGDAGYELRHLQGDWYSFTASDR